MELDEDTDLNQEHEDKIIKSVKKTLRRRHDFRCLTENTGKGLKIGLRS